MLTFLTWIATLRQFIIAWNVSHAKIAAEIQSIEHGSLGNISWIILSVCLVCCWYLSNRLVWSTVKCWSDLDTIHKWLVIDKHQVKGVPIFVCKLCKIWRVRGIFKEGSKWKRVEDVRGRGDFLSQNPKNGLFMKGIFTNFPLCRLVFQLFYW